MITNAPLLSDEQMIELTGYTRPDDQCRTLREHGIEYVRRRDGKPRTTWYNVNHPRHVRLPFSHAEPEFGALSHGS